MYEEIKRHLCSIKKLVSSRDFDFSMAGHIVEDHIKEIEKLLDKLESINNVT